MFRFFTSIFNKKKPHINFNVLKTDIHSHLIPGLDDGAPDMDTAISLIQELQKLGFKKLITTPHVMSDFYRNHSEKIIKGLSDVRAELTKRNINIQIDAAAEYYIDYDFEQKIGKEDLLTFGDNYVLVELSFLEPPKNLEDVIFKLQLEGYKIVLAHPERYNYFTKEDYELLIRKGVLFQVNILSFISYYSKNIRKKTEELIANNMVSFIGSDCHNSYQMQLYSECQKKGSLHTLCNSGRLLNSSL